MTHHGNVANHNSLIVASANQGLNADVNVLSQERYIPPQKNRVANAMSELRKSSKVPINAKKLA